MATEEPRQEEQGPLPRDREAVDWWLAKWGRREPLTREDVERLTEVNDDSPEGLYLSNRALQGAYLSDIKLQGTVLWLANLQGADLRSANLQGADLHFADLQGTDLQYADLQGTDLQYAKLQGARLTRANLQGARLDVADLQGAYLVDAKLQGAYLVSAKLQGAHLDLAQLQGAYLQSANLQGAILVWSRLDGANFEGLVEDPRTNMEGVRLHGATITETTKLRRVLWGEKMTLGDEVDKRWGEALDPYRDLKQWHQRTGDYDTADRFHYREWECKRKLAQEQKRPMEIAELWMYRLLSGYGGRPWRVIGVGAALILLFALFYMPWSSVDITTAAGARSLFTYSWKALYFSSVSFTAVGYGGWVVSGDIAPAGWTKYLGVVESLVGIFLIALFLITFTRKMLR